MRTTPILMCLLLLPLAAAQEAEPTTLEQAFDLAAGVAADLQSARTELATAERGLARSRADPLALRLELLQAEQAVAAAQAGLASSEVATRLEVASAFTAALEADSSVALALAELAIAEVTLEAQQIRFEAGAATRLDVDRSANDLAATQRDLADAEAGRDLAYAELASLLGRVPGPLEALDPAQLALPDLAEVQARAREENAQLLAGRRAVELAEVRLLGLDNAFTARNEIEAAQEALDDARLRLSESRRTLELNVQNSFNAAQSAQARAESSRASLATATADLDAQRTRLEAGTISPLNYAQSELGFRNAEASLAGAEHALYLTLIRLEQTLIGQ